MIILSKLAKLKSRADYCSCIKEKLLMNDLPVLSRPEHVLSVFILGDYLLKQIFGYLLIETNLNQYISFDTFWLYCAMFHDFGYGPEFQSLDKNTEYNHVSMRNKYIGSLYDINDECNEKWLRTFTREELEAYYSYWFLCGRQYCLENGLSDGYELYEHGILGGWLFNEMFHNNKPSLFKGDDDLWNELVLGVSLMIAQHNIWPIPEKFRDIFLPNDYCDKEGKPYLDIDKFNGKKPNFSHLIDLLSYSICLIDSIDIVKRFYGKRHKDGYEYIEDLDLLNKVQSNIDFEVVRDADYSSIIINSGKIKCILDEHDKMDIYTSWVNSIKSMESFLDLIVEDKNDVLIIKIKYVPKNP